MSVKCRTTVMGIDWGTPDGDYTVYRCTLCGYMSDVPENHICASEEPSNHETREHKSWSNSARRSARNATGA